MLKSLSGYGDPTLTAYWDGHDATDVKDLCEGDATITILDDGEIWINCYTFTDDKDTLILRPGQWLIKRIIGIDPQFKFSDIEPE